MPSRPDRWSQYDEPSYRTGGMERVGYDADTQRYYFQEGEELYEGEPGAEFGGQLRHIGRAPTREPGSSPYTKEYESSGWRQLAPFLLLVGAVLFLMIRYFGFGAHFLPAPTPELKCVEGTELYKAVAGDDCWSIANARGWNLEKLNRANAHLNCNPLKVGATMCVPPLA
ncbi:hypothetical protein CPB86DRAFT_782153 [Serendipita vermifera]|nr:hypothetical protein CPB86DRAFT_782153 [Serendipita vermifera]